MQTVTIPQTKYQAMAREAALYKIISQRLPRGKQSARALMEYLEHVFDIAEARKAVAKGKTISQEKLFKKLGL